MTPVSPQDLQAHWAFVAAGLGEIIRLTHEPWTPTHIRQALNTGHAALYVEEHGFVVLQRLVEDWTSDPYVHVWAMWFEPGKAKAKRKELIAWLDEVTAKAGCGYWKFGSPREGWCVLEDKECVIERVIWRRKNV